MSDNWKKWEGHIVDEKFPILQYLGGSEHCAVFLTERREGGFPVKAAVKVIPVAPENGELKLSRLRQSAGLSHPHLISLYEMGRAELDGIPLVYVVMECAEEDLAQVLPGRALTPAEAREMLESILDVLTYIHGEGFVHGHIKPGNIMAIGDQLKVSSDGLCRAGESVGVGGDQTAYDPPEIARGVIPASQTISPAGDVWSLGVTLVETMTQNLPVMQSEKLQDPLVPGALPEPYLDIARHCLVRHPQGRWTVDQIAARLKSPASIPQARTVASNPPTPLSAPQRVATRSKPPLKRRSYTAPVAVAFALVLAAILAVPRLVHRRAVVTGAPAATAEPSPVQPEPRQAPPQERSTNASRSNVAEEGRDFKAPDPTPALVHPGPIHEEATDTVARLPVGARAHGEVIHQVTPEVLQSARDTIRGTVRVSVKVNVDRSGNVEDAELESAGPSKYFARTALQAAQLWKFKPPNVGGRGVLSSWTLQFEFTPDQTNVYPTQEMP